MDIENGEKEIRAIQEPLIKILNIFKESPLQILVAEKIANSDDTIVNAQTIKHYLAETEELITTYIALIAEKSDVEFPLVSTMLTDSIKPKVHKENEPKIDFNTMQDGPYKQHAPEDDTEMWDHDKLYKRISKKHQDSTILEESRTTELKESEAKKDEKKEVTEDKKSEAPKQEEPKKVEGKKEEPPKEPAKI